jgi:hypothetical protein
LDELFEFLSPPFLRLPGIVSFNRSHIPYTLYHYTLLPRQPASRAIPGLLSIPALPNGFIMVFVLPFGQWQPPRNKNIRTNANPKSKAPGSKNFIDVRGSFTSLPFHYASGSASLRPGYISFQLRSFHPLPLYSLVLQPIAFTAIPKICPIFLCPPDAVAPRPAKQKTTPKPPTLPIHHVPDHHPKIFFINEFMSYLYLF